MSACLLRLKAGLICLPYATLLVRSGLHATKCARWDQASEKFCAVAALLRLIEQ